MKSAPIVKPPPLPVVRGGRDVTWEGILLRLEVDRMLIRNHSTCSHSAYYVLVPLRTDNMGWQMAAWRMGHFYNIRT